MEAALKIKNWESSEGEGVLQQIHKDEVNIVILNRSTTPLTEELSVLINRDLEFRASGDIDAICQAMATAQDLADFPLIRRDVKGLLERFSEVTDSKSYRLFLATIAGNMCRKFHTDINDLRMLCTYAGLGTLWLTEDNVNRDAADCCDDNDCLVIDENRIQQAETGAVIILKGAIYPKEGTRAVFHRSPTIEERSEKRILLRIDTDEFASF